MTDSINLNELWERTCKNEPEAYAQIHKQLYPQLCRYLMQMAKDRHLVEDLLQDLFVKIWQKRDKIEQIDNVRAFFYFSSRAIYIDYYRSSQRRQSGLANYILSEVDGSVEDFIFSREREQHFKDKLNYAINSLPSRQREMIRLRYLEEMDYDKISSMTGLKYQSVVNHVYRAVQGLRTQYKFVEN